MLIGRVIDPILIVTGIITALPVLQFVAPRPVLKALHGVTITEEPALLFARHWGLVTLTLGALLVYASRNHGAAPAIVLFVLVEKVGYAALVLAHWRTLPKMRTGGIFDAVCSVVYAAYLLGA
jgi:hypothetical protein